MLKLMFVEILIQFQHQSLRRHYTAVDKLASNGLVFWDYGNAFLLECSRAFSEESDQHKTSISTRFKYPSYMQDVMGDIFSLGFGPFKVRFQYEDNLKWIKGAFSYNLVVGSKARILYSDQNGRASITLAMNKLVRDKVIKPVVISRDHHDVSGTDSPFRETSNVYDGSAFTADMAVQNCIGDGVRGATWVALHNGKMII